MENQSYINQIKLLKYINQKSKDYIKNFISLLGMDSELFVHLYNIPTKITNKNININYTPQNNSINIKLEYIKKISSFLEINTNYKYRNEIELILIEDFIHETLHANRAILIKNGINYIKIKDIKENNTNDDLEKYELLLSQILDKPYSNRFTKHIPIIVKLNKDDSYTVITYNCKSKNYEKFSNQFFKTKLNGNIEDFLINISNELNDNSNTHKVTRVIFNYKVNQSSKVMCADDYFHSKKYNDKIINEHDLNKILDRIELQNAFEEILVETITNIIIACNKLNKLDLDLITKNIESNNDINIDVKICAKLIQILGIDILKWFMLSTYLDEYQDKFSNTFKDDYNNLLACFYDLYYSIIIEQGTNPKTVNNLNKLLEKNKSLQMK